MAMRLLITGATGFVGSHLVRRCVADGHAVRILRRETARLDALGNAPYTEVIGDITDPVAVDHAVAGCEIVLHSAALIQYWSQQNALQTAVNVGGTRHVVEAALRHRVQRLVHLSSIAATGYCENGALADEETTYNLGPIRNNYCDSKYAAEAVVHDGIARGLDAVIVNPGTIYGPGDRRRVNYIRGLVSPVSARGGMAVVDVEDVVEGVIRAWQRGRTGERYILIAENTTFAELGRAIAALLGKRGPRVTIPGSILHIVAAMCDRWARLTRRAPLLTPEMARLADVRAFFSNAKACRALDMQFRPFHETLARTIAWYRHERLL